ncbi:MAG: glutathione S-transferase [Pseudomonadales bacterium]|nr:glutathione S-transferase [Pseudomonadales bacterium]
MTDKAMPSTDESIILYTFRRCPYAMRARMGLAASQLKFEIREVVLRDKPAAMLEASAKATVPVLLAGDIVIDESLDILIWALKRNDPLGWLGFSDSQLDQMHSLVNLCDTEFKPHLDHYKYADRYPYSPESHYRSLALTFLNTLEAKLISHEHLFAERLSYADIAIFPFIRQFANVDADWFATQPYPNLQRWLASLLDSYLFKKIMTKHPQWNVDDKPLYFETVDLSSLNRSP